MPASPYHQRLYRARRELDAGPRAAVLRAVAEHYADLIAELAGQTMNVDGIEVSRGPLHPDDADRIVRALRAALRRLTDRLAGAIDREAQAAIEMAVTAAEEAAASIVKPGSGVLVHADFAAVPERAVEGLFVRRGLGDGYTYAALLRRGAARAQPLLEGLIARAVTTGQTGEELTRDLASALADVDPLVRTAARRATGANGRLLKRALLREARLDPNPDVLPAARRLWYEARRVAVTEVNVAFAEADRAASVVSPVVDLLQWTVSGRHDGLRSSPDVCDYLRFANLHGYGPGLYHPALFPALPHPHCACSRKHILRPASDWGKPKRPLPEQVREFDSSAKAKAERAAGRERTDEQWMRQAAVGAGRVQIALKASASEQGGGQAAGSRKLLGAAPVPRRLAAAPQGYGYDAWPFNRGRPTGMPHVQMADFSHQNHDLYLHYQALTALFPWDEYEERVTANGVFWQHPRMHKKKAHDWLVANVLAKQGKTIVLLPEDFTGQLKGVKIPDFEMDGDVAQAKYRQPTAQGNTSKGTLRAIREGRRAGPHVVVVFEHGAHIDEPSLRDGIHVLFRLDNILQSVSVYVAPKRGAHQLLFRETR